VTNTFYTTGSSLKVYYRLRIALDGFQGDLEGTSFATREEARKATSEYIEIFYNRQRKQARLGYLSPAAFTQQFFNNQLAA